MKEKLVEIRIVRNKGVVFSYFREDGKRYSVSSYTKRRPERLDWNKINEECKIFLNRMEELVCGK